jgi:hypothetical protein
MEEKRMKKVIAIGTLLTILIFSMAGCKTTPTTATGEGLKTGMAVISSIASSKEAGDKDGLAQSDSVIVAVTVDKDGKIVNCFIDSAQTKVNFSAAGKITTALDTAFKTKVEIGADYGMANASSIKKEWYEQAAAFAAYAVGKTVAEIKGIAVNAEGAPTGSDLTASVTISVGEFQAAIEKAVANAKDLGAKSGDKLGLGVTTTIDRSTDAGAEDGLVQVYSYYSAVTFAADGKITSCVLDASQNNINFSTAGKVTSDLTAPMQTKVEIGDAYGMKKQSKIGKEWYEQANAFAAYVVGKTSSEVSGIAMSEGKATDADLLASVTVSLGDFIATITKAGVNAK